MLGIENNEFALIFGKVLREERRRVGYTQEELSFESGLQRNYISLMELGKYQPTVATLFKLSSALKISPTLLVSYIEDRTKNLNQ